MSDIVIVDRKFFMEPPYFEGSSPGTGDFMQTHISQRRVQDAADRNTALRRRGE